MGGCVAGDFLMGANRRTLDDDWVTVFVGLAKRFLVELFLVQKSDGDSVRFSRFLQKTKFLLSDIWKMQTLLTGAETFRNVAAC